MATANAQARFRPVHEAHAIEHLLVTVHFDRPLDDHDIRIASESIAQLQSELPGRNEIRGVGFQIGPQGVMPLMQGGPTDAADGFVRFLTDSRGVVLKELRMDRQSVTFRTQLYTRWNEVWAEARKYIDRLLPRQGEANLSAYSLAYVDKFIWSGHAETAQPKSLFLPNSPYLVPKSLEAEDLWHCHTGRFYRSSAQVKRLEAVNIDCSDELDETGKPQRIVRISTTITNILNQAKYEQRLVKGGDAMALLDQDFPALHDALKAVFSEIVSEATAGQIGLNTHAS
jgi:uncharacterized protein (TIGR04255 family)